VLDPGQIRQRDRDASAVHDHEVLQFVCGAHASERSQREPLHPPINAAGGDLDVLRLQAAADVRGAERIGHQPGGIDQDVDLARLAADDLDLPYAARSLQARPDALIRVLGDVPDRTVGGECQGDDGDAHAHGDERDVDVWPALDGEPGV